MKISSTQARNIVDSLKNVIDYNINFINLESIIIASTNQKRIGDYHEGSKQVVESGNPIIIYEDDLYTGTKAGINNPVYFEDQIVAIIGITGKYEEVKKFSSVIVNMTEILIKEVYFRDQRELKQENIRYVIELLLGKLDSLDNILNIADSFNINLKGIKHVCVIKLRENTTDTSIVHTQIFSSIRKRLKKDELCVNHQGHYILLLKDTNTYHLNTIREYLSHRYKVDVVIGLSEELKGIEEVHEQYINMERITTLAYKMDKDHIVTINDFDLELILLGISDPLKEIYLKKVFKDIDEETIKRWSKMLIALSKHDGSISGASKELIIHKNTLQYRLKKVYDMTGYDPRKLKDFTIVYLATLLYNQ